MKRRNDKILGCLPSNLPPILCQELLKCNEMSRSQRPFGLLYDVLTNIRRKRESYFGIYNTT